MSLSAFERKLRQIPRRMRCSPAWKPEPPARFGWSGGRTCNVLRCRDCTPAAKVRVTDADPVSAAVDGLRRARALMETGGPQE